MEGRKCVISLLLISLSLSCSAGVNQSDSNYPGNSQITPLSNFINEIQPGNASGENIIWDIDDLIPFGGDKTLSDQKDSLLSNWCERLYTDDSIWNIPIDWDRTQIHPNSDGMISAFFKSRYWISSNTDSYAPNIYFATDETPLVPVQLRKYRFRDAINDTHIIYGEPASVIWMPIPEGAEPAPGSDGQLAVINLTTGEEWGLNKGELTSSGLWLANGAYRYHINASGIPPEGFGQRGGGIGQIAGIIRPCEVDRGFIGHAVTLAYDSPCRPSVCNTNGWPEVIPPFTKTDGRGLLPWDIPEGARLLIRPEITWQQINRACHEVKGCIIWALSMQTYGGFIVDNSSHPKTYAEGNGTAKWDLDIWSKDMLRDLPTDWFAIIDF